MIVIKTKQEIAIMREGGVILATIMDELRKEVREGVTTKDLDKVSRNLVFKFGVESAFLGHIDKDDEKNKEKSYPAVLCASVNNVVVHAVPTDYKLKDGDIISLDLGIRYKEFYSDMAITLAVGNVEPEALRMIKITKKSLKVGLQKLVVGKTFNEVSGAIQEFVESQGFGVVRELCGHGIGRELHEDPKIANYWEDGASEIIKPGMVVCLEPMVTMGDWQLKKSKDGFGFETKDGSLACHFEHTIAITENGAEILTKLADE